MQPTIGYLSSSVVVCSCLAAIEAISDTDIDYSGAAGATAAETLRDEGFTGAHNFCAVQGAAYR